MGASTLAAAIAAARAVQAPGPAHATRGGSTLVDLDLMGGGIDVTVGLEHVSGPRWPDLMRARGRVDGPALRRLLPRADDCAVLAADGRRWAGAGDRDGSGDRADPRTVGPRALPTPVLTVIDALRQAGPPIIIDCPATSVGEVRRAGDLLILVGSTSVRGLADLDAAVAAFLDDEPPNADTMLLVLRGGTADDEVLDAITDQTGIPLFAHLADDRRVTRTEARGDWPGRSGSLRRVALDIVDVADERAA